jgi:hypothetical protein
MTHPYAWDDDPVLETLRRAAESDPDTLGLILSGSRASGCATAESDYDLEWVLTDAAGERHKTAGGAMAHRSPVVAAIAARPDVDLGYSCPRDLEALISTPDWRAPAYATAAVLVDRSGEVARLVRGIGMPTAERAERDARSAYDAYLNAFYRSMKAWRRGDELGGRLQAADSALYLLRALFALEGRWPPYLDRLANRLDELAGQGWPADYLRETLQTLVATGDPRLQSEVEARVAAVMHHRGYGRVKEEWHGEIERVAAFR